MGTFSWTLGLLLISTLASADPGPSPSPSASPSPTPPVLDVSSVRLCPWDQVQKCACPKGAHPVASDFYLWSMTGSFSGKTYRCLPDLKPDPAPQLDVNRLTEVSTDPNGRASACAPAASPAPKKLSEECQALPRTACLMLDFPKNCGYDLATFDLSTYQDTVDTLLKTGKVLCGKVITPAKPPEQPKATVSIHSSMCTSATFLFFMMQSQIWVDEGKITKEKLIDDWSSIPSGPWDIINVQARPDLLAQVAKFADGTPVGTSKTLYEKDLPNADWPAPGDYVQIWRKNISGHSVVFEGYLKNPAGKTVGICYWASNPMTNGYGKLCEDLSGIKSMIAARFTP